MTDKKNQSASSQRDSWTIYHYISAVLLPLVLLSAFLVVYSKDLNRRIFLQYQSAQQAATNLHTQYGKLLLEQSAWAAQARVQEIAQTKLQMQQPTSQQIVVVQLPSEAGDH